MVGATLAHRGDTSSSWSIVLTAELSEPLDPTGVARRIAALTARYPHLGPAPGVRLVDPDAWTTARDEYAGLGYRPDSPLIRIAVRDRVGGLIVAAHHGAVDGLGLLALLGAAVDAPVTSTATGVADRVAATSFSASTASRLGSALGRPAVRVAPAGRRGARGAEVLVSATMPAIPVGTTDLICAAASAVQVWNSVKADKPGSLHVAVGASRAGGAAPTPVDDSTLLRLRLPCSSTVDRERVARELADAAPEPDVPRLAGWLAGVARLVLPNIGSPSFLLSNLGRVSGPESLRGLAFYPVGGGRDAIAFGAVTVADSTSVTVRVRGGGFDPTSAATLLDGLVRHLPVHQRGSTETGGHDS